MTEYLAAASIVFIAGFIQGLAGFGAALIAVPLLSLVLDIKTVIPLVAMLGLVLLTIMFVKLRDHVDYRKAAMLAAGSVPGLPFGIYALKNFDEAAIRLALAVVLVAYSLFSLLVKEPRIGMSEKFGVVFGFVSGVLGGAITTNGPPVIIYAALQGWEGNRFKATLTGFFLINGVLIVIAHAAGGVTTHATLEWFARLAPFMAAGTLAGSRFYDALDQETFRKTVYVLILLMGAVAAM